MTTPWTLRGHDAQLRIADRFEALLSADRAGTGLHAIRLDGDPLPDSQLLTLKAPQWSSASVSDLYVRGDDLVVAYSETEPEHVQPQIYWRALQPGETAGEVHGAEMIISVQTRLLDSDPTACVESVLPAEEVLHLTGPPRHAFERIARDGDWSAAHHEGTGILLVRLPRLAYSYVQCIHPADFDIVSATPLDDGRVRLAHRLFSPGLEKGVIRRGRLRGVFVPRGVDEQAAVACFEALRISPPPLTT